MKNFFRKISAAIIFLTSVVTMAHCQHVCTATVGDVIESLSSALNSRIAIERFQTFSKFDFRKFVGVNAITEAKTTTKHFKIGYDKTDKIQEITYYDDGLKPVYRLLISYFNRYKLMIVQDFVANEGFQYDSSVIVVLDNGPKYFMFLINMSSQFGDPIGSTGMVHSPKFMDFSIDSMSAIMTLSESLRPWELFRFTRTQLVQVSHFYYRKESPNLIKMESASFYFNTESHGAFKVTENTCPIDLATLLPVHADFSIDLNPNPDDGDILWHWAGAHGYKVENKKSVLKLPE